MTDLAITAVGDAWVNSARTGTNYGSTNRVHLLVSTRHGLVKPGLPSIAGRTVLDAYLVGHAGAALVAQTITVAPITERWQPGRVTWSSRPAVNTAAQVAIAIPATAAGGTVTLPGLASILQAVADGTEWHGLRLTTDAGTSQQFYATDSGQPAWELHVTLSDAPEQPTNLRPDVGASAIAKPVLAWDFLDLGGDSTEQAASRVQVDTPATGAEPDPVAPDYDSGWVTNVDPHFDLGSTAHMPSGVGPHYWRVKVRDGAGDESVWSDWAEFTVSALPSLIVDSPTGPFGDPSPTLLAHLATGTITSWHAYATGPDRADIRIRSGVQTGPIDWTIPAKSKDGRHVFAEGESGWIYLRVYDAVDRAVTVGQKPYVDVWIAASLVGGGAPTAPTGLVVEQVADGDPRHVWQWQRTEAADAWLIQVDGVTVARLEPEDVTLDAGVYTWTDNGEITPLRPHTLGVRAVEGAQSTAAVTLETRHTVSGVWLLPEDGDPIQLDGTAVGGFVRSDRRATYTPLVGPPVDIIYDWEGRTGTFEGSVDARQDVWAALDAIEALRTSRNRVVRMVWGSQSITARIVDPDATSAEDIMPNNLRHNVRFGFVQVGD